ncbi:MAG: TetR/AcrR family transcriptional regulator [Pseudomonadota bacterium]
MPRPARFDDDTIIDATAAVVAASGPAGATVARIARRIGAPTGSIYHRFRSRDVLLGEVWLNAVADFQAAFRRRLERDDPFQAGLEAVLSVPERVRDKPGEARILALYRSEEFRERHWPPALRERAGTLRRDFEDGIAGFAGRLFAGTGEEALKLARFALAEAPLAAVRSHVQRNEPPPAVVDAIIEATYRSVVTLGRKLS